MTDIKKRCVQGLLNKTAEVSSSFIHLAGEHHGESVSTCHLWNRSIRRHFGEKRRERRCGAAMQSPVSRRKKMVCASKPWRLCVVRVGHRRAHISRKPRAKSSKNLNVALPHQPTFISRQLKDRFQHVNVQHDQYFVFQFKLYAQRNLGTLFLTWSR